MKIRRRQNESIFNVHICSTDKSIPSNRVGINQIQTILSFCRLNPVCVVFRRRKVNNRPRTSTNDPIEASRLKKNNGESVASEKNIIALFVNIQRSKANHPDSLRRHRLCPKTVSNGSLFSLMTSSRTIGLEQVKQEGINMLVNDGEISHLHWK